MDVVAVLPSLRSGGAERVLLTLAALLAEDGRAVRVVSIDPDGPLRPPPGVTATTLGRRRVRWSIPSLVRVVRRDRPDVLLASDTHLNVALCLVRPLLPRGTRLVVRESRAVSDRWEGRRTRALRWLRDRTYRQADLIVATSTPMEEGLRSVGIPHVVVLPNPVDVAGLRAAAADPPPTITTGGGRRFVAVGRLVPVKRLDDLVVALAAIAGEDDRLDVVGDGPERGRLRRLAETLGVADRVVLHGHLDAPAPLVAAADVLVLPSESEGMPNVVLEALAVGTPVIATTDLPELGPLAAELGPHALRLVPRHRLAATLDGVVVDPGSRPRASLLPARFERHRVADQLGRELAALAPW